MVGEAILRNGRPIVPPPAGRFRRGSQLVQSLEGMDLIDRVREVKLRAQKRLDKVETEEAAKTALVMPFISHVLGYNVFDPAEDMGFST